MLSHLTIANFAIIEQLEISFRPGLNILSGETGAGKSILISALNLILGARASADLIRSGCSEARVEALFTLPRPEPVAGLLAEAGIPFEGELLIKRILFREGRNRVSINGSLATLQLLARLSPLLVSISGQHEHQLLLNADNHLSLLDGFAGLAEECSAFGVRYAENQALREEIRELRRETEQAEARRELTRFQAQEIDQAGLQPDEDQALEQDRRRLRHAGELLEIVAEGYQQLYERSDSALSAVSQCAKRLDKAAQIDSGLGPLRDLLAEIELKIEDAAYSLRDFQREIAVDPERLLAVEDRLALLHRLKRKYGASLAEVLSARERMASDMEDLEEKGGRLERLGRQQEALELELWEKARRLSEQRRAAAAQLEREVEQELKQLHMAETRFQAAFLPPAEGAEPGSGRMRADGIDQVAFLISPNLGEALRPLARIASGGELSRLMLAMKTILARSGSIDTVVFDEVDSGISGATAEVLGDKLLSLARYHQIACITHLPQIASKGRTHFLVRKEVKAGRTQTVIAELAAGERVLEIARLLGGREIKDSALAHAREMLR